MKGPWLNQHLPQDMCFCQSEYNPGKGPSHSGKPRRQLPMTASAATTPMTHSGQDYPGLSYFLGHSLGHTPRSSLFFNSCYRKLLQLARVTFQGPHHSQLGEEFCISWLLIQSHWYSMRSRGLAEPGEQVSSSWGEKMPILSIISSSEHHMLAISAMMGLHWE